MLPGTCTECHTFKTLFGNMDKNLSGYTAASAPSNNKLGFKAASHQLFIFIDIHAELHSVASETTHC